MTTSIITMPRPLPRRDDASTARSGPRRRRARPVATISAGGRERHLEIVGSHDNIIIIWRQVVSVAVVVPPSLPTRYTRDERTNRVPSLSIIYMQVKVERKRWNL
jgi:hypothetical protein